MAREFSRSCTTRSDMAWETPTPGTRSSVPFGPRTTPACCEFVVVLPLLVNVVVLFQLIELILIRLIQFTADGEGDRRSHQDQIVLLKHNISHGENRLAAGDFRDRHRLSIVIEPKQRHRCVDRR